MPVSMRSQSNSAVQSIAGSHGTERHMMARLRAGRQDAWEWLVQAYSSMALAAARGIVHDENLARTVVKDAMLNALSNVGSAPQGASPAAWLLRIVVVTGVASLAKKGLEENQGSKIEELLPAFDADGKFTGGAASTTAPIEEHRRLAADPAKVRACISRLPGGYRIVLMLCDYGDLGIGETATILGIAPTEVRTRLHRARIALMGLLAGAMGDLGLGSHAVEAS